jgi:hypothetical protein
MTRGSPLSSLFNRETASRQQRRELWFVLLASLLVTASLVAWTFGTQPILGDESRHFRQAVNCEEAPLGEMRVTHDPAYPITGIRAVPYWGSSLWHLLLALLWKAIGYRSLPLAQLFHAGFFWLLAVFTYLAGRELFGHRTALWAWLLVLSVPMNLLFGMIFYQEVPMLAFAAMALYFLARRHSILLGLCLAGKFLMKSTSAAVLTPPLVAATVLLIGHGWRQRLLGTAVVLTVFVVALVPDLWWHKVHFGQYVMFRGPGGWGGLPDAFSHDVQAMPSPNQSAVPFSIFNPLTLLEMFGITGLFALGAALVVILRDGFQVVWETLGHVRTAGWRRTHEALVEHCPTSTLMLGLPLLVYLSAYFVLLRRAYDVRYLEPVTLFTALLAAPVADKLCGALYRHLADRSAGSLVARLRAAFGSANKQFLATLVAAILALAVIGQTLAVPVVVHFKRQLHPQAQEGFRWIIGNTPPNAYIVYLEENLTAVTGRPILWAAMYPRLLFTASEERQVQILTFSKVRYIAIHPTRRTPSTDLLQEATAYPDDWVASLNSRPYLRLVYPPNYDGNPAGRFLLYELLYDKIPAGWNMEQAPENRTGEQ